MLSTLSLPLRVSSGSSSLVSKPRLYDQLFDLTGGLDRFLIPLKHDQIVEAPSVINNEDARQLELTINKILQDLVPLLTLAPSDSTISVEQDIWTPMPPKRTFTLNATVQYEGRARPKLFVD
jgi:hypothetical protein